MNRTLMRLGNLVKVLEGIQDRLSLQKSVYLLQEMDLDLGYRFKWFMLGPYSRALANDMFDSLSYGILDAERHGYHNFKVGIPYEKRQEHYKETISQNTEQIRKFVKVLSGERQNSKMLECIASLHFLMNDRWNSVDTKKKALERLDELKPDRFDEKFKKRAWGFISELGIAK